MRPFRGVGKAGSLRNPPHNYRDFQTWAADLGLDNVPMTDESAYQMSGRGTKAYLMVLGGQSVTALSKTGSNPVR